MDFTTFIQPVCLWLQFNEIKLFMHRSIVMFFFHSSFCEHLRQSCRQLAVCNVIICEGCARTCTHIQVAANNNNQSKAAASQYSRTLCLDFDVLQQFIFESIEKCTFHRLLFVGIQTFRGMS